MRENCTKVIPMVLPEPTDPYVFDTTQEFVKIELTEKQFDKFMDMIENPPIHTKEVINRLERYKEIWKKGTRDES